jgi:hypothetical protein
VTAPVFISALAGAGECLPASDMHVPFTLFTTLSCSHSTHYNNKTPNKTPNLKSGYSCHPAELPPRDVGGYFTLIFLRCVLHLRTHIKSIKTINTQHPPLSSLT